LDLAIPKLRHGSYFPDWLLERRKRAERALTTVVATCYLLGVSTRRMDKLVDTLGITSLSKSQVSVMAKELDTAVEAFRTRPLDAGPYTFVAADALVLKVREGGRVVNVHALVALVAVGVNAEGYREILGIDVTTAEDGAGWLTFADRPRPVRGQTGHQRRAAGNRTRVLTNAPRAGEVPTILGAVGIPTSSVHMVCCTGPFLAGPLHTIDDIEYTTMEWVDWFNNRRLHSQLNYIPPDECEAAYYART